MTHIAFHGLTLRYGSLTVLEDVSLELPDYEFCVILGPSGVGKTSLLRMLLSQEVPTGGRILIDGRPIAPEPRPDRGVVFQRYSVFPHKTVLSNVMLGPQLRASPLLGRTFGATRRALRAEAVDLLAGVGLGDALGKYPSQLSGGMQQRLAIAQALIMHPKVLLLDEPFGALDPAAKKAMHKLILDLWVRTRMTIVMVTHDIQEAFTLGTRIVMVGRREAPDGISRGAAIMHDLRLDPDRKPPLDLIENGGQEADAMQAIFEYWRERVSDAVVGGDARAPGPTPVPA